MKHSYLLLIIASMLLIPAANLNAMNETGSTKVGTTSTQRTAPPPHQKKEGPNQKKQKHILLTEFSSYGLPIVYQSHPSSPSTEEELKTSHDQPDQAASTSSLKSRPTVHLAPLTPSDDKLPAKSSITKKTGVSKSATENLTQDDGDESEIDEETQKITENRIRQESGWLVYGPVALALTWAAKKTIVESDETTAKKEITIGLRQLIQESEENFEEIKKLMDDKNLTWVTEIKGEKTTALTLAMKTLKKIACNLELARRIVKSSTNIQIDDVDLKSFDEVCENFQQMKIQILAEHFVITQHRLENQQNIRFCTQRKSQHSAKINCKSLAMNFQAISDRLINQSQAEDSNAGQENKNELKMDEEMQAVQHHYADSWLAESVVKNALFVAGKSTIAYESQPAEKQTMTDGLRALIDKNERLWKKFLKLPSDQKKLNNPENLIKPLHLLSEEYRRLVASYVIVDNKSHMLIDEIDLQKLRNACQTSQINEMDALKQHLTDTVSTLERVKKIRARINQKILGSADVSYEPQNTSLKAILEQTCEKAAKLKITETNES